MTVRTDLYELDIPDVPPNLNSFGFGSRGAHMKLARLKKIWELALVSGFTQAGLPKNLERVTASATCRYPVKRKRDEGNVRWSLEKFTGDALQKYKAIPDDTPAHYSFPTLTFDPERGPKRTLLTLEVWG
jgi:hypothetical protein